MYSNAKKSFVSTDLICSYKTLYNKKVAPRRGLEPPTCRLTAECSTIELSRNIILLITFKFKVAPRRGLEPPTCRLTAECSTIELSRNIILLITFKFKVAPRRGLEPPTCRLTAECSTIELSRNVITQIIISIILKIAILFYIFLSVNEKFIKRMSFSDILFYLTFVASLLGRI